jgi:glutathione S-transferase
MFAALNTVEPSSASPSSRIAFVDRLVQLAARLGDADWLEGAFSAGDQHRSSGG